MPRYHLQPMLGYWSIINADTGEVFADVLNRKGANRVMRLLRQGTPPGEVERPVSGEQMMLWETPGKDYD